MTPDQRAARSSFPDWRFAPNIGGSPDVYEIENQALDRGGHVLDAMRALAAWAERDGGGLFFAGGESVFGEGKDGAPTGYRRSEIEHDVVRGGQVGLQARQDVARTGSRGEEPILHLFDGLEPHELVREGLGKPPPAEIPPVELLQEPRRPAVAELAHGLAHEHDQLGSDLLP